MGSSEFAATRAFPAWRFAAAPALERAPSEAKPRASYYFLLAFIFLLYLNVPIVLPAFEMVHPAKLAGGAAILALLVEIALGRRRFSLSPPEGYLLLAFAGVAALSCITALWPGFAVNWLADLLKMALIYYFIANVCSSEAGLRGAMWTMLIGGLVPAAGVLRNYLHGNIVEGRTAWVGLFANPNDLAYSLAILIPLAAALSDRASVLKRIVLAGISILFAAAIFVTFSRGGLIGLAAVIFLCVWRRRSVLAWISLALVAGAGFFALAHYWTRSQGFSDIQDDSTFEMRIATSQAGLEMFRDHPLLGVGPGCSVVAWPLYAPPGIRTRGALITHNTFIQALSETGFPGFLAFFSFVGFAIWKARKLRLRRSSGNVGTLANGLEIAIWGFAVCGLSAGIMLTWFPYILAGLVSAARRIPEAA